MRRIVDIGRRARADALVAGLIVDLERSGFYARDLHRLKSALATQANPVWIVLAVLEVQAELPRRILAVQWLRLERYWANPAPFVSTMKQFIIPLFRFSCSIVIALEQCAA